MPSKQKLNNLPTDTFVIRCRVRINLPSSRLGCMVYRSCVISENPIPECEGLCSWIFGPSGISCSSRGEYAHYTPHDTHLYVESCRECMLASLLYEDECRLWFMFSGCGSRWFWDAKRWIQSLRSNVALFWPNTYGGRCDWGLTRSIYCTHFYTFTLAFKSVLLMVYSQKGAPGICSALIQYV